MKSGKVQEMGSTAEPSRALPGVRAEGVAEISRALMKVAALDIPESEITPRVREALHTLASDVDRLARETESLRARLADAAHTADQDVLLPILNRRAFSREVARFISFADRYGTPAILLYLDLNNFKAVNDLHGHAAGDSVLRHFSDLMAGQIRESDVLARLGGDEFGVILAHVTADQARKKAEKLSEALRDQPPCWNGSPVDLTFALGAYELRGGESAESAIAQADHAMYEHKRATR